MDTNELTVIPVIELLLICCVITEIPVAYFDKAFLYLEIFIKL
jgi:hypothetical protein